MSIQFIADKVAIKTGKVDHSGSVTFDVGQYALIDVAPLVACDWRAIKVTGGI